MKCWDAKAENRPIDKEFRKNKLKKVSDENNENKSESIKTHLQANSSDLLSLQLNSDKILFTSIRSDDLAMSNLSSDVTSAPQLCSVFIPNNRIFTCVYGSFNNKRVSQYLDNLVISYLKMSNNKDHLATM
ncbi:hypothetical protein RhiirA5_428180 [Rhizophagus irregularis]|uniref:Uncharacterized protein n=1 Tax=Rhizophagus irregularis TaxID=588596 RepID=A0A2N0P0U1_9GLOM|nr:hypothetical protein RhiirA5_428180 [Rhizophagus irregularis]PKC71877.1 hypothetical protein RhiirA1_453026 [Rhizophagus irregularis]